MAASVAPSQAASVPGSPPAWDITVDSIPQLLCQVASRHPERVAIRDQTRALTYAELAAAITQVAAEIRRVLPPAEPDAPQAVGILFSVRTSALAGLLGVLQSGRFFTSLDDSFPTAALQGILASADVSLILTDGAHAERAQQLAGGRCPVLAIDSLGDGAAAADGGPEGVTAGHLAALFYTSGSTGEPKGVMHTHRSLLADVLFRMERLQFTPADRVACFNQFSVSASIWKTVGPLLAGGCVCLYDLRRDGVNDVADWVRSQEITVLSTLSAVRHLLTHHPDQTFPSVRIVQTAGDTLYLRDLLACRRSFPNASFSTGLVLSETGAVTSWILCPGEAFTESAVPIGYAVGEKQVFILAEDGQRLGPGEVGEIAVQSRHLAPGYWRNPELTRQRFLSDPDGGDRRMYLTGDLGTMADDGCLYHLGRKDFQVKIRNQRVQLPAVEAALLGLPNVQDAVVMAQPDPHGEPRLVAYLVTHAPAPSVSQLHRSLSATLPEYMVPKSFVFMDRLPRTRTDKVDRKRLPPPQPVRPELDTAYAAPRTPLEETLTTIWAEMLGLDRVGIHDDFLELGGHSIVAGRIIARVGAALGEPPLLQHLFTARTVAQMALAITYRKLAALPPQELATVLAELE